MLSLGVTMGSVLLTGNRGAHLNRVPWGRQLGMAEVCSALFAIGRESNGVTIREEQKFFWKCV